MRYFTSDLHFFHKNIGNYTNGMSLEDRHSAIISSWCKQVKAKDVVYIIGDVSFGSFEDTKDIISKLPGTKILIRGNHDYRFTSSQLVAIGFKDVRDTLHLSLSNGAKVLLNHYPYAANSLKRWYYRVIKRSPRRDYYELYPRDEGRWLIHGHHHSGPKVQGRQINVCVDVNKFKLISETELCQLITKSK